MKRSLQKKFISFISTPRGRWYKQQCFNNQSTFSYTWSKSIRSKSGKVLSRFLMEHKLHSAVLASKSKMRQRASSHFNLRLIERTRLLVPALQASQKEKCRNMNFFPLPDCPVSLVPMNALVEFVSRFFHHASFLSASFVRVLTRNEPDCGIISSIVTQTSANYNKETFASSL